MASVEERMKILKMIQEGKISAEQGVQLLDALDAGSQQRKPGIPTPPVPPTSGGRGSHWFRVLVTDTNTGKTRVNVRLPVGLVSAGMKMGARFSPQVEGLDPEQLMEFLNSGETGKIIDVVDDEDGEHVEVFIE
jgi:hypothetical protein